MATRVLVGFDNNGHAFALDVRQQLQKRNSARFMNFLKIEVFFI
jgi:hypothetical protein